MSVNRRPSTEQDYRERILKVLVHLQQNLDAAYSIEELAEVACFSPYHFHRIFSGMVGESVKQHVRRLRLERAAQRLKYTERPVTDIAFEAGYETHESFTRAFKSSFGHSPSAYRTSKESAAELAAPSQVHFIAPDNTMEFQPMTDKTRSRPVEIRTFEPMRVAFVRHVGPYHEVGPTWERLMDWAGAECIFGPNVKHFGACWDDPDVTPAEKIRYDACITVEDSVEPAGDIGIQEFPGGRYAVMVHEGPFDGLKAAYEAMFGEWLPKSDHEPADGPSMEFYLNDPDSTEPEDLLTEIAIRLKD